MWSFLFDRSVFLLLVFNVWSLTVISAEDIKEDDIQRDTRDRTGMWFGPRLGKRSLHIGSESDRQAVYRMLEAADALKYYYDQLQYYGGQSDEPPRETKVSKKVIFTPKLGRAVEEDRPLEVDFTPRLGRRRLSDEAVPTIERDMYRNDEPEPVEQRSQYFSPRLGRGGSMNFSPRLGRNLVYELYPEGKVRVTRSANKTKST